MNYEKVYNSLVEKAKKENRVKTKATYYEAHHIIPKCLGGTGYYYEAKAHANIVLLTAKEHFLAHRLLCKMYPGNQRLFYALWRMCNMQTKLRQQHKPSARVYEEVRLGISEMKKNSTRSLETREKISKTMSGRPAHNKGVKVRDEVLYKWKKPQPIIKCPKCGKTGGSHAMKRHHFDKCKQNNKN